MLKIKSVSFYRSFANYNDIPNSKFAEVTFIGKSNVGKSSLINDLCTKKIANVSTLPGKTRLINFFLINNSFYFVDLPGYGYAKTSKSIIKKWPELIESYLEKREQIKYIIFIIDIRRVPNEQDKLLSNWFQSSNDIKTLYVISKSDKLNKSEQNLQKQIIGKELNVKINDLILYSTIKKIGKEELLRKIEI